MAALRAFLSSMLFRALTWAGELCTNGVFPESGFALLDHVFKSFHVHHLVSCFMSCTAEPACQSLNYNPVDHTCELNNNTKYFRAKYFVKRPAYSHTLRTPTLISYNVNVSCSRNMRQYATRFFVLQLCSW